MKDIFLIEKKYPKLELLKKQNLLFRNGFFYLLLKIKTNF